MKMTSTDLIITIDSLVGEQLPPISPEEAEELRLSESRLNLQPDVNIGMIGHVAHGKTSLTRAISGVNTIKFDAEKKRNITIKLGYANFKIYKCDNLLCPPPVCFQSFGSQIVSPLCCECESHMTLVRHMSIVDCPGHEMLMRTMLNGASVMDTAILVVAANQSVPQPQTAEHLVVAEIMGLQNILAIQNKVDLVPLPEALRSRDDIVAFLKDSVAEKAPIIPMSCAPKFRCNVDVLLQYLVEKVPLPVRDLTAPPLMRIIRSYDINKPGTPLKAIKGGVCGGTLQRGVIRIGEIVEIRPGIVRTDKNTGKQTATPIVSKVVSIFSEANPLKTAIPGGLIAVGLKIDPSLTRKDSLVGQVVGRLNELPPVFCALDIQYFLMKRVVGDAAEVKVAKPQDDEAVFLTIGSASVAGSVMEVSKHSRIKISLNLPVCAEIGDKVSISRKFKERWRLIGWGVIKAGQLVQTKPLV